MSNKIMYYDLARRGHHNTSWTFNVWKSRLVLNYKQLPYHTEWLDHTNIGATLSSLGIPPNTSASKGSEYTLPTIRLSDGSYVMDSAVIAEKLESLHPTPSLHMESGTQDKAAKVVGMIAGPLVPVFIPRIGKDVIVEHSIPHFRETRAKAFGMSLEELEAARGGEQAWKGAEAAGIPALKALLTEEKLDEGPFILGSKVSYGDFIVVAFLESFRRIGQDLFDRLVAYDQSIVRLHEACRLWMKKDT